MLLAFCLLFRFLQTGFRVFIRKYSLFLDFKGFGFHPYFYFSARDFRILYASRPDTDRVFFSAEKIHFWVNPFPLLIGRIYIHRMYLENGLLEYVNRMDSYKKASILPARKKVQFLNSRIIRGRVLVRDETMGGYQLQIKDIDLKKAAIDAGCSIDIFFRTGQGQAKLGSAGIQVSRHGRTGSVKTDKIRIAELAGFNVPLFWDRISLNLEYIEKPGVTRVKGLMNIHIFTEEDHEEVKEGIPCDFILDWDDYQMTFDLGFQKLIETVLHNTRPTLIQRGLIYGGKQVFEILKKPDRPDI